MGDPKKTATPETTMVPGMKPSPVSPDTGKRRRAFSFVGVLFLLALLGVGIMTYLWYDQKTAVDAKLDELNASTQTITTLNAELQKLKKAADKSDDELIGETCIAYVASFTHSRAISSGTFTITQKNPPTITIVKKEPPFALVRLEYPEVTPSRCVVKKTNGIWIPYYSGTGVSSATEDTLNSIDMPDSLLQ
jgi:hypothetical protein